MFKLVIEMLKKIREMAQSYETMITWLSPLLTITNRDSKSKL